MRSLLVPGLVLGLIAGASAVLVAQKVIAITESDKVHHAITNAHEANMAAFHYWHENHAAAPTLTELVPTLPRNPFTGKPMELIEVDPNYGLSFHTGPLEGNIAYLTLDLTKLPDIRQMAGADSLYCILVFRPNHSRHGMSILGLSNQVADVMSTGMSIRKAGGACETTYEMDFNDFMMHWREQHLRYPR